MEAIRGDGRCEGVGLRTLCTHYTKLQWRDRQIGVVGVGGGWGGLGGVGGGWGGVGWVGGWVGGWGLPIPGASCYDYDYPAAPILMSATLTIVLVIVMTASLYRLQY